MDEELIEHLEALVKREPASGLEEHTSIEGIFVELAQMYGHHYPATTPSEALAMFLDLKRVAQWIIWNGYANNKYADLLNLLWKLK